MQDRDRVRQAFADPQEFWSSPLYRALSAVVADDPALVDLAAHARAGQHPTFAFFGAVHALLLRGADHPLGRYFASLHGSVPDPAGAGPELQSFAKAYREPLIEILSTRLVQTNHVQRAAALRLALTEVGRSVGAQPVHLLEVGSSAGLLLRQSAYGYVLGGRQFGAVDSPVQLDVEWRSDRSIPDLDAVPALASVTGIDLNPLHPASPADRLWLEALVWPEDREKAALLSDALQLAAELPVQVLAGDAVDLCPAWAAGIPAGEPRLVFHCATRMHVPAERLDAFDAAIAAVGAGGPLWHVAVEGDGLVITDPSGAMSVPYDGDGHLAWVAPRSTE